MTRHWTQSKAVEYHIARHGILATMLAFDLSYEQVNRVTTRMLEPAEVPSPHLAGARVNRLTHPVECF